MTTNFQPPMIKQLAAVSACDYVADFKSAMGVAGIATKDTIICDGRLHRVHVDGDKTGTRNGWYVLFGDGTPAGRFGNWKSGADETWVAKQQHHLSPAEQYELRRRMEDARRQRSEEQQRVHAEAAQRAAVIWEKAGPAPANHPYLVGKRVGAYGLRSHRGLLVIPMRDIEGKLRSLQFIGANGEKRLLTGGRKSGCIHVIGSLEGSENVFIAEGYATAATAHEAAGAHVLVAFDAGNLQAVAKAVRSKLPSAEISVIADNDRWTVGNPGIAKATEAAQAVNGRVIVPTFKDVSMRPTDFNDLAQMEGLEIVREQLVASTPRSEDDTVVNELATLDLLAYGKRRLEAARSLGITASLLDQVVAARRPPPTPAADDTAEKFGWNVEPWTEVVYTAELLTDLSRFLAKHVVLPKGAATATALWILHAWAHNSAEVSPLLTFTSPDMRCGKTTALKIVMALVPRPLSAANISPAGMFRAIEVWHPTLGIDEADTFMGESEELRGVINSGHGKDTAFVVRVVDTNGELLPVRFSTWCPKTIATIGKLKSTLMDRSIVIEMHRKRRDDAVTKLRRTDPSISTLRRKLCRWAKGSTAGLEGIEPTMPEILNDRAADNWQHLIAIADLAGGKWPEQARQAAILLSGGDTADVESTKGLLLADIRDLFQARASDRLSSEDMVAHLGSMEGRPWPEWGKTGKPITKNQLARQLAHFSIESRTIRLEDGRTSKGYLLELFADAFERYIPSETSHRHNLHEISTSGGNGKVTGAASLPFGKSQKPASIEDCDVVTDRSGDRDDGVTEVAI